MIENCSSYPPLVSSGFNNQQASLARRKQHQEAPTVGMKYAIELFEKIWFPGAVVVSDMERNGIMLDIPRCKQKAEEATSRLFELEKELHIRSGVLINWHSPKQVSEYLYGIRGFKVPPIGGNLKATKLNKEGKPTTSEAAIDWLARNYEAGKGLFDALLSFKCSSKLLSFYGSLPGYALPDSFVHPQLSASTDTGRLSCRNPNLQQQPPETRELFIAPPGQCLVVVDFAGLEWRILAHIVAKRYGDFSLVDDVKAGIDPHSKTAKQVFSLTADVQQIKKLHPIERDKAKTLVYSINYGKTPAGLAAQLRISLQEAQGMLDGFYEANPGVSRWHEDCVALALAGGARTLLGRWRDIPELKSRASFARGRRLAMNTPIQGSAADIVTVARLRCNPEPHPELVRLGWFNERLHRLGAKLLLEVHDELIVECPEKNGPQVLAEMKSTLANCMVGVRDFLCPLEASGGYGPNWALAKG